MADESAPAPACPAKGLSARGSFFIGLLLGLGVAVFGYTKIRKDHQTEVTDLTTRKNNAEKEGLLQLRELADWTKKWGDVAALKARVTELESTKK